MPEPSTPRRIGRRILVNLAVIAALTVTIKTALADSFVAKTDAVVPEVPRDARLVVYKLATRYDIGDIVAFRTGGQVHLGRVAGGDAATGEVVVARNGEPDRRVSTADLVGRAVLNTR